ncbi:MAG: hypothetical protein ACPL7M_11700 [Bryobacteraceae bacterium]
MTTEMRACAEEIRQCWIRCDAALAAGNADEANDAFGRVFEIVDQFPVEEEDVRALAFLCILTWVKVAVALEAAGQADPALEAQAHVFELLDTYWLLDEDEQPQVGKGLEEFEGLETPEATELLGRLYLLCSKYGRPDSLYWGRCFMAFDRKLQAGESVN